MNFKSWTLNALFTLENRVLRSEVNTEPADRTRPRQPESGSLEKNIPFFNESLIFDIPL